MSANMSNSGKYVPYICIHSKWRLLPFAHIAPSQLHTDLGHCAKGHDGVYLVFFMLTCTRRTHGQVVSTYLYVISLYSSLDLIIFIQHSLGNAKSLQLAVGQELHGLASVLEEEGPKSLVSLQDLLIAWAIAGTSVTLTNGHCTRTYCNRGKTCLKV